jgi:hypothetical protein
MMDIESHKQTASHSLILSLLPLIEDNNNRMLSTVYIRTHTGV